MAEEELSAILLELESICERLDDVMLDILHTAAREGETGRPERDRQLVRVRRALERAITLMRNA